MVLGEGQSCYYAEAHDSYAIINNVNKFITNEDFKNFVLINWAPRSVLKIIRSHFKLIKAAGGLVINENGDLLMIYRKGKWDLPKGKLDAAEDVEDAAIREVVEETGIEDVTIKKTMMKSFHFFIENNATFIKETHWYLMSGNSKSKLKPQSDEGIYEVRWCNKSQIAENLKNSYRNIIELIGQYESIV